MSEFLHGDWVVAIFSIVAAIIGATAAYYLTQRNASKKKIQFLMYDPQTITGDLEGHGRQFTVMLGDQVASELNVSLVEVINDGNEPIENLTFDITIPGERKIMLADCMSNDSLKNAIQITFSEQVPQTDPVFNVRLAFFNPGEFFRVKTLVDGPAAAAKLFCRMPGTTVNIIAEPDRYPERELKWYEEVFLTLPGLLIRLTAFALVAILVWYQLPKYQFFLRHAPSDVIEQELKDRNRLPAADTK